MRHDIRTCNKRISKTRTAAKLNTDKYRAFSLLPSVDYLEKVLSLLLREASDDNTEELSDKVCMERLAGIDMKNPDESPMPRSAQIATQAFQTRLGV